jgi:hypothetical protein
MQVSAFPWRVNDVFDCGGC